MKTSYYDLIMKMLLVAFLTVSLFTVIVTGELRAICPTQSIEAEEGDDATLQCHLDPPIDVSAYTADWKRVDLNKVVYSYRNKRDHHDAQMKRYRDRTAFNLDGPSRGNLTLRISSLQLDDSGLYRCFVPKLRVHCFLNITVVPKAPKNKTKTGGDTSTTIPPVEDVTKSDDPDAAKTSASYPVVFLVVGVVVVIIGVLVIMYIYAQRRLRRRREEAEMATNNVQMENLMNQAAEEGKDQDSALEKGLRCSNGQQIIMREG